MAKPELRRLCDLCRHRVVWCARLHTEAHAVTNRFGGSPATLPEGTTLCFRCLDHNPHICVRAYPLPIARDWVPCVRCKGTGTIDTGNLTGHWRARGVRAREVQCPPCAGKGEVPG